MKIACTIYPIIHDKNCASTLSNDVKTESNGFFT